VWKSFIFLLAGLTLGILAYGQTQPDKKPPASTVQPAGDLVDSLVQRLSNELHARTVAGDPIKLGTVTVIPILMVDINVGGGSIAAPPTPDGKAPASSPPGGDAFLMSGEARPVGFVALTKKGVQFLSVLPTPAKSGESK
jgi:uncharacterized spore protein YtfJ